MARFKKLYLVLMALWFIWFWNSALRGMMSIIIPGLKDDFFLSASIIGLMISSYSWGDGFGRFSCGLLCKKFGTKKILSIGIILSTIFSVIFTLNVNLYTMLILLPLSGFTLGLYEPVAISILTELFEEKRRGFIIGIHETAVPIGITIGSIYLGLTINQNLSWSIAIQYWSIIAFIAVIFFIFSPRPRAEAIKNEAFRIKEASINMQKPDRISNFKTVKPPLWVLALLILTPAEEAMSILNVLVPITLFEKFGITMGGLAFLWGATRFSGAFGQIAAGSLSDRIGRLRMLTLIPIINGIIMIFLAFSPIGFLLYAALLLRALPSEGYRPVFYALMGEMFPYENRSKMVGLMMFASFAVNGIYPIITGWLIDVFGFQRAWIFPILLTFLASLTNYITDIKYFKKHLHASQS